MLSPETYKASQRPTWCPGCGDFGVLAGLTKACGNLDIKPEEMVVVSGIGCSGKISQHFGAYGIHTLHGRVLPTASAVKVANHKLKVLAAGGDGDGYGIGVGHFVHTCRRNIDITYLVMDNHIYGLTTGQTSPVSDIGMCTKTHPEGAFEEPIHPLETAIICGATFVAQAFTGDPAGLARILTAAMDHKGFSLVNVFSPCVTFNKTNTGAWWKERLVDVSDDAGYDPSDKMAALTKIQAAGGLITGILYQTQRKTYEEQLPGLQGLPLTQADLWLGRERFDQLADEFR